MSDALRMYIDAGVPLIPSTAGGRCFVKWGDPDAAGYIRTQRNLDISMGSGVHRFQFVPARAGFVVLDIDVKNGKNGFDDVRRLFETANVPLPSEIANYRSHTCYVKTPGGGIHLYFRYSGVIPLRSGPLRYRGVRYDGAEILHDGHLATAAGSRKESGEYIMHGSLDAATVFPPMLIQLARIEPKEKPVNVGATVLSRSLSDVVAIVDRQGEFSPGQSRNRYTYEVARFAHKCGIAASEVISWAHGHLGADDFTAIEIQRTVESAYTKEA